MNPHAPSGLPTLEDVAALAGVSRATVSRVINNKPNVSEQIRLDVEWAIKELHYVPNRAARVLVTRRTEAIGLVVRETHFGIFADPYLAPLVRSVSDELALTEHQLVLLLVPEGGDTTRLMRFLRSRPVDGIVLVTFSLHEGLCEELIEISMPVVKLGRSSLAGSVSSVDADNVGAARLAVDHLIAEGCTRIAIIVGPEFSVAAIDRLSGYRTALEAAGLDYDQRRVVAGDYTVAVGESATATIMAQAPDTDAIFATSDSTALGVLRTLRKLSFEVPRDVAVVGFDDIPMAEFTDPPLTTVAQPLRGVSSQLVQTLIAEISEPGLPKTELLVDTTLVVRESSLKRASLDSTSEPLTEFPLEDLV